jgi:hypothetical protein
MILNYSSITGCNLVNVLYIETKPLLTRSEEI